MENQNTSPATGKTGITISSQNGIGISVSWPFILATGVVIAAYYLNRELYGAK